MSISGEFGGGPEKVVIAALIPPLAPIRGPARISSTRVHKRLRVAEISTFLHIISRGSDRKEIDNQIVKSREKNVQIRPQLEDSLKKYLGKHDINYQKRSEKM